MCAVQEMQSFAMRHNVNNVEALPPLLNSLANRQLVTLDEYLIRLKAKPDLSQFVAEMARHYSKK